MTSQFGISSCYDCMGHGFQGVEPCKTCGGRGELNIFSSCRCGRAAILTVNKRATCGDLSCQIRAVKDVTESKPIENIADGWLYVN